MHSAQCILSCSLSMPCLLSFQIACPDVVESIKDADILIFVLPHQVSLSNYSIVTGPHLTPYNDMYTDRRMAQTLPYLFFHCLPTTYILRLLYRCGSYQHWYYYVYRQKNGPNSALSLLPLFAYHIHPQVTL